jgi:hypothetical protein
MLWQRGLCFVPVPVGGLQFDEGEVVGERILEAGGIRSVVGGRAERVTA